MSNRLTSIGIVWMMVIGGLIGFITIESEFGSAGEIIYVGSGGGNNSTTIAGGISQANPGDIVYVYSGTYTENLAINTPLTLMGENKDTTIIDGSGSGVVTITADSVTVTGFTITNGGDGIYISSSSNNNIIGNNISSNLYDGIRLYSSPNSTISDNDISSNDWLGIRLSSCSNNTVEGNNFNNNGIGISPWGGPLSDYNSHTISTTNMVNGKPLYYYKDSSDFNIDGIPVGQLILANCTNVAIKNLQIHNTDIGMEIAYSNNINITDNNVSSNNWEGIYLYSSSNSTVSGNKVSYNGMLGCLGIHLWVSCNNEIVSNNVHDNEYGIYLSSSSNNNITGNNVSNNDFGIKLTSSSSNNTIIGNNVSNNTFGIYISSSSDNNTITKNDVSSNGGGIYLDSSSNNTIIGNDVSSNTDSGINLTSGSNDNSIYHNNFIDNAIQAFDLGNNIWNDTYPSGGNYWSDFDEASEGAYDDYKGANQDDPTSGDGIVDNGTGAGGGQNPYLIMPIDSQDNYPLIEPHIGNVPSEPQSLQTSSGDSYVNLSWAAPVSNGGSPITNYRIYRGTTPGGESFLEEIGNLTFYNDTGVTNTITYYYKVSAVNSFGEGALSSETTGTPTGSLTVDYIIITASPDGTELASVDLPIGGSVTAFASGYNNTGPTYVDVIDVNWTGSGGTWSPGTGPSSTFTAGMMDGLYLQTGENTSMAISDTFNVNILPPIVDYIQIVDTQNTGATEIADQTIEREVTITGYAAAYNITLGYMYDITVNWSVVNESGASASTSPAEEVTSSDFFSGSAGGTATWTADDGAGHSHSVVFSITEYGVDYILIVDSEGIGATEIVDQTVNVGFTIQGWAAGFNDTVGYIGDFSVSWSVDNISSAATTNPSAGINSIFDAGEAGGTATWEADGGAGHTDTVTFTINPPAMDFITIVDTLGTGTTEIPDQTVDIGFTLQGWAAGFNVSAGYIGDISVNWLVDSMDSAATTSPLSAASSTFDAGEAGGIATWTVDDSAGHIDTVTFTINPPTVDYIQIRNASFGQGSVVIDLEFTLDMVDSDTFYCAGYNSMIGYIEDVIAEWEVHGGIGTVSPGTGTSTEFTATTVGTGSITANFTGIINSTGNITVHLSPDTTPPDAPTGLQVHLVASGGALRLSWDANTGSEPRTLTGHSDWVRSVAWSPDSTKLASGSDDDTIKIWDANTGSELRTLTGHSNWVYSVAWSPDGTKLASGSIDDTIKIWNADTGSELRTLTGHNGSVYSVAWSPDGTKFASGSFDDTIKIWNANIGSELRTLTGHNGSVRSVAWSPDGTKFASGSVDDTIKIWNADTGLDLAGYNIYRSLTNGSGFVKINTNLITDTTYLDTGLTNGTAYYYRITAVNNASNESPFSLIVDKTVEADADGDGVVDNNDAFPNDPAASIDSDGDGYPNEWNSGKTQSDSTTGLKIDIFPNDPKEWADSDGDGVGDNSDFLPNFNNNIFYAILALIAIPFVILMMIIILIRKKSEIEEKEAYIDIQSEIVELESEIQEMKEKGIKTEELEKTLNEMKDQLRQ